MKATPCPPSNLPKQTDEIISQFASEVEGSLGKWLSVDSASTMREMELEIAALGRRVQDRITTAVLCERLADPEWQAATSVAARRGAGGRLRSGGRREVKIALLGGSEIRVKVSYLKPDLRGRRGRRRGTGRRGKGGQGVYPALLALGIACGTTPALASELCHQISSSDSLDAGCSALRRRGVDFGRKRTRRLFNRLSSRAVERRLAWLDTARRAPPSSHQQSALANKRVVLATDGGRVRIREARRGRRRKNGHRGFNAPWREPKMIVVYTIDENGDVEQEFRPVYDGTLGDCDAVFDMIVGYLRALGVDQARELIVVGDGARWIWDRVAPLVEAVGIAADRVTQVIDWYHAVQVLHAIADARKSWSAAERDRWIRRAKKRLHRGDIDELVRMISALARGRRAREVHKHIQYFERNRARMQYAAFEAAKIPRGSGAVESMIRRVVNLRLKGNAKYWLEPNAEGMLLVRSYLKAGRLEELLDWSAAAAASWWQPGIASAPSTPLGIGG